MKWRTGSTPVARTSGLSFEIADRVEAVRQRERPVIDQRQTSGLGQRVALPVENSPAALLGDALQDKIEAARCRLVPVENPFHDGEHQKLGDTLPQDLRLPHEESERRHVACAPQHRARDQHVRVASQHPKHAPCPRPVGRANRLARRDIEVNEFDSLADQRFEHQSVRAPDLRRANPVETGAKRFLVNDADRIAKARRLVRRSPIAPASPFRHEPAVLLK